MSIFILLSVYLSSHLMSTEQKCSIFMYNLRTKIDLTPIDIHHATHWAEQRITKDGFTPVHYHQVFFIHFRVLVYRA